MRAAVYIALTLIAPAMSFAFQDDVFIDKTGNGVEISWMTTVGYIYQVDVSADLTTWVNTGIEEPGTGESVTYAMPSNADALFYCVRESLDFLVLPEQDDDLDLTDGVCFAFDLNVLPELPTKIRIYRRPTNTLDPWEQIGLLAEFAEIDDIRFVREARCGFPTPSANMRF